jgi:hypothetical protein
MIQFRYGVNAALAAAKKAAVSSGATGAAPSTAAPVSGIASFTVVTGAGILKSEAELPARYRTRAYTEEEIDFIRLGGAGPDPVPKPKPGAKGGKK